MGKNFPEFIHFSLFKCKLTNIMLIHLQPCYSSWLPFSLTCAPHCSWFRDSASELGRWKSNKTEHATITYENVLPFALSQQGNHLPQHVPLIIIKFIPRTLIPRLCLTKALPYSPQSSLFDTQCTNIVALRKAVCPSVGGSACPMVDWASKYLKLTSKTRRGTSFDEST